MKSLLRVMLPADYAALCCVVNPEPQPQTSELVCVQVLPVAHMAARRLARRR
jgi:hypothetical protein